MCVAGDFIIREVIVLDQCFLLYRMEAKNSHPTGMLPLNVNGSSVVQAASKLRYFTTIHNILVVRTADSSHLTC